MNDMSQVIIPKSDQWNSDDFISGPLTFTIKEVQINAGSEQPVNILLEGSDKAFRPCKSMSRVFVQAWGADAKAYIGRSVTLYRDPEVKWGGMAVGGIRISHMSHIDGVKTMILTATKDSRKPHKVMPIEAPVKDDAPKGDPKRVKAEQWLSWLRDELSSASDENAARAIFSDADQTLARMEKEYPDLYELATALKPGDRDDSPHPASATADKIIVETQAAATIIDLKSIEKASELDMAAMPDHMASAVQSAFDAAHKRLATEPAQ